MYHDGCEADIVPAYVLYMITRFRTFCAALIAVISVVGLFASIPHAQETEWRIHREPGIEIQYRPRNADELPRLIGLVERARRDFEALADTSLPITINVVAAASTMEFSRLTAGMLPEWGAAVAIPSQQLLIVAITSTQKPLELVVPHEVSHVMLGALARDPVPRWFDEGLAMRIAGEWTIYDSFRLARGALMKELHPLTRIDYVLSFHQDQAWLAYTQSFGAVSTLFEQMTDGERSAFLRNLAYMPFDEALAVATNIRRTEFEANWLSTARTRYALVALADDLWLWAVILPALFLMALAVMWLRNRRTMKRWMREEDDDDDDDEPDEPLDERIAETYG